jgi:hypothetical protein
MESQYTSCHATTAVQLAAYVPTLKQCSYLKKSHTQAKLLSGVGALSFLQTAALLFHHKECRYAITQKHGLTNTQLQQYVIRMTQQRGTAWLLQTAAGARMPDTKRQVLHTMQCIAAPSAQQYI